MKSAPGLGGAQAGRSGILGNRVPDLKRQGAGLCGSPTLGSVSLGKPGSEPRGHFISKNPSEGGRVGKLAGKKAKKVSCHPLLKASQGGCILKILRGLCFSHPASDMWMLRLDSRFSSTSRMPGRLHPMWPSAAPVGVCISSPPPFVGKKSETQSLSHLAKVTEVRGFRARAPLLPLP